MFLQRLKLATSNFSHGWGLPRAIIKPYAEEKGRGPGIGELPKVWKFPLNVYTMAEAMSSNLLHSLSLPRPIIKSYPYQKVRIIGPGLEELPNIVGFPFNICAMAEASNFKFGMQLGFAKAHNKTTHRGNSVRDLGLGKLPNIWGYPLIFTQRPRRPLSVSGASC